MTTFDNLSEAKQKRRVAIYIRVSTAEQKIDGYSLAEQKKQLEEYVSNNKNMETAEDWVYCDTHTGSDINRERLSDLLKDVRAHKFDAVLVWKIDRLSRSLKHLLMIFEELEKNGVSFISVQENIDFRGPIGKLIFQVFGAIAQFERELIKGRTRMGKLASASLGNYTGPHIPYGYKPVPNENGKGKTLAVIPEEKKWVRRMYDWYIYDGLGDGQIAKKLNELKVPRHKFKKNKSTGRWLPELQASPWTTKMITPILTSTIYRGEYLACNVDENDEPLPEDKWTMVKVPECVSEFSFRQAENIRETKVGGSTATDYLLAGKMKDMTLDSPKGFVGAKRYKGGFSYRRKQFVEKDGTRVAVFEVPGQQIEDYVWSKVMSALTDPEAFVQRYLSKQYADPEKVEKLEEELSRLRADRLNQEITIARIERSYDEGIYDREKMERKIHERNREIGRLDTVIQDKEAELGLMSAVDVEVQKLKEAAEQVKYRLDKMGRREKKILCNLFVERVEMWRQSLGKLGTDKNRWKIWADVYFRFNPNKFRAKDSMVSTTTELEQANTIGSMSEKDVDGGPGGS